MMRYEVSNALFVRGSGRSIVMRHMTPDPRPLSVISPAETVFPLQARLEASQASVPVSQ